MATLHFNYVNIVACVVNEHGSKVKEIGKCGDNILWTAMYICSNFFIVIIINNNIQLGNAVSGYGN